jgi:FlaA1/EpsC-like NDP-sugar epimerase
VIDAALDTGVQRVLALSNDKAASPIKPYGATIVSECLYRALRSFMVPIGSGEAPLGP